MCHDVLKGILCCAVHWSGIACALQPALCQLPSLTEGTRTSADGSAICVEALVIILLVLPQGISIADVFIIQPLSLIALPRTAVTAGAAAAQQDQQKQTACAKVEPNGHGFVPFSVET
jgi:hypothetical protein